MKLSIIIPAYNVEKYISKTLYSLLNQDRNDFELIIVNDGSTDKTNSVVEDVLSSSGFDNYHFISQKNAGVSSARNKGLTIASGDYVIFLDGDDYVSKNLISTVLSACELYNPDVICWGFDRVLEDGTSLYKYFDKYRNDKITYTGKEALEDIIIHKKIWICTGSAAFKKELLKRYELCYTEGCINGEDQEFTFKSLSKADKVINEVQCQGKLRKSHIIYKIHFNR